MSQTTKTEVFGVFNPNSVIFKTNSGLELQSLIKPE